jgi:phospholipase/carboxylesterase
MAAKFGYVHRFEPGADASRPPVLLLHGTGGDESDLIPLGREIAPGAALLSPRGNVLEGHMPRFFRRFREGLFDEDDVRRRAGELSDFVAEARRLRAPSCSAPWRRWRSPRDPTCQASRC